MLESDRAFNEQVLRSDLDEAYRQATLLEQQRQANLDEAYRRDNLAWNQATDQRDYDRSVYENDRNYNRDVLESDRAFNEQVRQYNAELNERMRQFNENLNWDQLSNDQKYAAQYALDLLSNGQMPSDIMLQVAEISPQDAQKFIDIWNQQQALLAGGSGGAGGSGSGGSGNKTYYRDMDNNYYELQDGRYVKVNPDDVPNDARVDDTKGMDIAIQGAGDIVSNASQAVADWWNGAVNNANQNNKTTSTKTTSTKKTTSKPLTEEEKKRKQKKMESLINI